MLDKTAILLLLPLWLLSFLAQATTVRVVTEYRSYYQLKQEDGQLGGYATEVVQAMFALTGDTPAFEVNPWGRTFYEAVNNDNVLIYSLSYNPERAALFDCVAELDNEQLFFWALKGKIEQPLQALQDLQPFHIAVSISSNPDQYLTAQGIKRLLRTSTAEHALSMLYKERVDLVISAEKSIYRRTNQLGYDANQLEKVLQLKELNHPLCAAFNHQSDPALRERYRQAFTTLQQNGTLAKIKQRWQVD
ncbi:transporter substrate-binding domain-containing protein [Rheinheimera baltica]|uniref:Transporter substrate-binding domain-containing protein n=1 Tax=Rheinheimera baltica TaxID=67576 RepID=A0ABT9I3C1_9GAMM|nr:transporter substrate-binding domain-containing protein [Rheinheimera baltica]MDP5137863.1 transporter substrate-binding domain-containing protein [Rheinheimera baltica]